MCVYLLAYGACVWGGAYLRGVREHCLWPIHMSMPHLPMLVTMCMPHLPMLPEHVDAHHCLAKGRVGALHQVVVDVLLIAQAIQTLK